jgi:outer membrane lipopolysaccharide assembly protein LptE/RlpB
MTRKLFILLLLLTAALSLLLSSCGYHRTETTANLPDWMRNIYIEPFSNNSNEYLLGPWLTSQLREEFLMDSHFNLTSREDADVILEGNVESVYTTGLSYLRYDQAVERRITVVCSVVIRDRKSGNAVWKSADIRKEEGFYVGRDVVTTEDLKNAALKKISLNMAEIIHHRIAGVF